jgi:hypothetical protein
MRKIVLTGNLRKEVALEAVYLLPKVLKEIVVDLKQATPVDTGEAQAGWYVEGKTIKNDVEHIIPLNNGHSQQAPKHFIEQTLLARTDVSLSGTIVRS